MKQLKLQQRIVLYLLHFSIIVPVVFIISLIFILDDREGGMVYGLFTAMLLINFGFSYYFIETGIVKKILCGLIATVISLGSAYWVIWSDYKLSFDFYGIWTCLFVYAISSVFSWELIYKILLRKRIK